MLLKSRSIFIIVFVVVVVVGRGGGGGVVDAVVFVVARWLICLVLFVHACIHRPMEQSVSIFFCSLLLVMLVAVFVDCWLIVDLCFVINDCWLIVILLFVVDCSLIHSYTAELRK